MGRVLCAVSLAVLTSWPGWASETVESNPPVSMETPAGPAGETLSSRRPEKGLRFLPRALGRRMASLCFPMAVYSQRRLVMLLPGGRHLPPHLRSRDHWDYPGPLQWVPRSATTFGWGRPSQMVGNQKALQDGAPKPIGERGSFQVSRYPDLPVPFCWLPVYMAFTLPNGVHFRLGARWDDVDSYTNIPSVAIKKNVE